MTGQIKTGTATCHASAPVAINVNVGFLPKYVRVVNFSSQNSVEFHDTMTVGDGHFTTGSTGADTDITSGGITLLDIGDAAKAVSVEQGFIIGTDVQSNSGVLHWVAIG